MPTANELGYDAEFCVNSYWFAPKGTPKEAIDGMAAVLGKAMGSAEVKAAQERQASTTEFVAGDAFKKHLDDTFARIEPVAKQLVKK